MCIVVNRSDHFTVIHIELSRHRDCRAAGRIKRQKGYRKTLGLCIKSAVPREEDRKKTVDKETENQGDELGIPPRTTTHTGRVLACKVVAGWCSMDNEKIVA